MDENWAREIEETVRFLASNLAWVMRTKGGFVRAAFVLRTIEDAGFTSGSKWDTVRNCRIVFDESAKGKNYIVVFVEKSKKLRVFLVIMAFFAIRLSSHT